MIIIINERLLIMLWQQQKEECLSNRIDIIVGSDILTLMDVVNSMHIIVTMGVTANWSPT